MIFTLSPMNLNIRRKLFKRNEKRSGLKGQNLVPMGTSSFLLEQTSFQNGPGMQD